MENQSFATVASGRLLASMVLLALGTCPSVAFSQSATNTTIVPTSPEQMGPSFLASSMEAKIHQSPIERPLRNAHLASLSSSMLKAYDRVNSMRAYHLDLHSYRPEAKQAGDPDYVDSDKPEHKLRCSKHLNQYKQALKSFKEQDPIQAESSFEHLALADVYGRPEAGLMFGNQFWLGSYDNCLAIKMPLTGLDGQKAVQSHYCLGISQFPNWNAKNTKSSIKVGLCLPETCTSSMINEDEQLLKTVETMMKYQFGSDLPFDKLQLRQVYCLPHHTSPIRQYSKSAIYFFSVVGAFVGACLIASAIDYFNKRLPDNLRTNAKERTWRTILIESFSLSRNIEKLFNVQESNARQLQVEGVYDRARFLNSMSGLKSIGLIWIICAHTFLVTPIPDKNLINMDKFTQTNLADVYLSAHLIVDTFFALSGLLAAYFLFREGIDNIKTKHWIVLTIHRYWRLTPIYIFCYWYTKSVGFLTNSGPLWDYMTAASSPRLNCNQESWLQAFLHLSDFKSPKEHCVPFAWFIANGIKFWIITPIFIILIHKSIRRGYIFTMASIVINIVLVTILAMKSRVDIESVIQFRPESADNMLNEMDQVYTRPYSRIGPYLIGLIAGHIMYRIDTNQLQVNLSRQTKIIIWSLFSLTVVVLMFMLKIAKGIPLEKSLMLWTFSISSALIRPLWALCTCWLVFGLAHGHLRWVSNFLSASFWRILVKLSFCAYLVQGEVLASIYLSKSTSDHFAYWDMITRPIVSVFVTAVVSLVMVLLLEYPLIGIEELILPKRNRSKDSLQQNNNTIQTQESSKIKTT